jgi:DMSO/TMAO reductase YedYZ molybdopterin-dependent catalytic subunit
MNSAVLLTIEGEVATRCELSWSDLAAVDEMWQIPDVGRIDPSRRGGAVTLEGILRLAGVTAAARYLTLHSESDDFHASLPLDVVRDRGLFIYRQQDQPLEPAAGGPVRFFICDFAACQSHEVDECANVKFVERVELSAEKGFDNRPLDDESHEELHRQGGS